MELTCSHAQIVRKAVTGIGKVARADAFHAPKTGNRKGSMSAMGDGSKMIIFS